MSSLHPAAKVLFECLATTDICVGLFSQPLFVTCLFRYIDLGNTDIDILYYFEEVVCISNYVVFGVTVLISTAISVDVIEAEIQTSCETKANSSCYTFMLDNCCFMRIGSCLESNGFGDCCFCGRCGISGYFAT